MKLTQEEKRIRIAEARGISSYLHDLPNYFSDLNACHEMFGAIAPELRQKYWWRLCEVTGSDCYQPEIEPWKVFDANAAERAEAFGLTLNLWNPSE